MPILDGLPRVQDVFGESVESELLYLQQRLNSLQPPVFVLIQQRQTVTGDRDPQLGLRQKLRGAYRHEILQRLLFVVSRIGDEEGGFFAGGIAEVRRARARQHLRRQSVVSDEMNREA